MTSQAWRVGLLVMLATSSLFAQVKPKPVKSKPATVRTDKDGRKWLGDVPYDVFFDDPLGLAANSQAAPAQAPVEPAPGGMRGPAAPAVVVEMPTAATGSDGRGWPDLISAEELLEESKRVRNHLTAALKSVGSYNSNQKEIQTDGAVLAGLAGIALRHPGELTWKDRAAVIGELGQQIRGSAKGLGKESFDKTQAAFEKAEAVFSGSNPPGVPKDVAEDRPFPEFAARGGLMQRMQKAYESLNANFKSEKKLKADQEAALREASLLAAFTQIVSDPGYDSAIEEDYQKFAMAMLETSREAAGAIRDGEFERFRGAMDAMKKRCDECHNSYGTE